MESGTYRCFEINKYGSTPILTTRKIKENLLPNECFIKIEMSTIHPADMFFLAGAYGPVQPKVFPLVPGFECAGVIEKVGFGVDQSNIGKRVNFVANSVTEGDFHGVWAEYCYAPFDRLMVFDDKIPFEQISFATINPLTVCGFLDTVRKSGAKAVIQTAAYSAVGKMLIRLCAKEKDVKTINLVRKEEQVKLLKDIGADYVINTSENDWQSQLKKISHELNATICFECIGGEQASKILSAMPYGSTLYNYGNLLFKPLDGFSSGDFIFSDKKVNGWWLGTWLTKLPDQEKMKWFGLVVSEIMQGTELFKTNTSKRFLLENFDEALSFYKSNMSEGKVMLVPKL
jgi:NADPH2:quinone reductase